MLSPFFRLIACEIAFREISHVAARSSSLIDTEFLTQGLHDNPGAGGKVLQRRIDAVPEGKYDAILVGYGLCGNLLRGVTARHTPLVIPRAHDCITFFLGSKERYQQRCSDHAGCYYYTSGWLECLQRRGLKEPPANAAFLPGRGHAAGGSSSLHAAWKAKFGEEAADYLMQTMNDWSSHYTGAALIDFDFTKRLNLDGKVRSLCAQRGWEYEEIPGDTGLLQRWVDGDWNEREFLVVAPGESVEPSYQDDVIAAQKPAS